VELDYYILRVSTGDTILALSLFSIFGFAFLLICQGILDYASILQTILFFHSEPSLGTTLHRVPPGSIASTAAFLGFLVSRISLGYRFPFFQDGFVLQWRGFFGIDVHTVLLFTVFIRYRAAYIGSSVDGEGKHEREE